jgi:hypothetical protein
MHCNIMKMGLTISLTIKNAGLRDAEAVAYQSINDTQLFSSE